jgi:hypothetical protein
MPYYLAPYVGSGKPGDAFRPFGHEQPGWSAIDLRPDGGATKDGNGLNACLLYLPKHDPSRRLYRIADHADEVMGQGLLHRLRHTLSIDPLAGKLRNFVADVMMDPPRNAWKALRPSRGWFEVYLGGLLLRWPMMAGMTTYTETWTHANTVTTSSTSLDSTLTWTKEQNNSWSIQTNQADFAGDAAFVRVRAEHDLATVDFDVEFTLVSFLNSTGNNVMGPAGRMTTSTFETNYSMNARWDGAGVGTHLFLKWVAGVETVLGEDAQDPANGQTLKVRCSGSSISGYRNGSVLLGPVTDSGIDGVTVGGKRGGLFGYGGNAGVTNAVVDDWSASDLAVPSRPMFRGS